MSYDVAVCFKSNQCGYFPATIYFEFKMDVLKPESFSIVREVEASVQTSLAAELGPVEPYKPFKWAKSKPAYPNVVEGVPPQ